MVAQNDRTRKQAEYRPAGWKTTRLSDTRILARCEATDAALVFIAPYGRIFGCESGQSGEYYDMPAGGCPCMDQDRAQRLGRMCRHQAAFHRVERHLEAERQAEEFRAGALNPQKFDQRVEQLAREIEAEHHLVEGEVVELGEAA